MVQKDENVIIEDIEDIAAVLLTVVTTSPVGGGFKTLLVFDSTATTGGLYAWNGTDYTKVSLATS